MQSLRLLLKSMLEAGAESVQLQPDHPARFRLSNGKTKDGRSPFSATSLQAFADEVLDFQRRNELFNNGKTAGAYVLPGLGVFDYRAKRIAAGVALAFRLEDGMSDEVDLSLSVDAGSLGVLSTSEFIRAEGESDSLNGLFKVDERSLTGILRGVLEHQVSDLVVSANRPARVRIGGEYRVLSWAVFDTAAIMALIQPVMTAQRHAEFEATGSLDMAFELKDNQGKLRRFRVNLFRHLEGVATAWRPIWDHVPKFEDLGLPAELIELANIPYGLVLITGPTGSGKSTTLSSLIEHMNRTLLKHIITLEDPIEYRFRDERAVIHQREVGIHVDSFSTGLRSALREAPDVILVGEMRDQDTISAALTAAETGHLVLSTLHSGHSAQAIDRIIDVFPDFQQQQVRIQLADVLRAVVTQRLLPTKDGSTRVPAVELVNVTYAVANTIREGRTHQLTNLIQSGLKQGMIPFDASLAQLVKSGQIDRSVAERCARDQSFFSSLSK